VTRVADFYRQQRAQEFAERAANRRAEQIAKYPEYAAAAAGLAEHRDDLASLESQLEQLNARYEADHADLRQRIAEKRVDVTYSQDSERLLLERDDRFGATYRFYESRLRKAEKPLNEPEPQAPKYTTRPLGEIKEQLAQQRAEHNARIERAKPEIARLTPIVERLRALCLVASPSDADLQEILGDLPAMEPVR
jgi:chromosome segregation ATPase